jgi:hypothetical protein
VRALSAPGPEAARAKRGRTDRFKQQRQRSEGDEISSRSLDIQGEDRENKQNKFCKKYLL